MHFAGAVAAGIAAAAGDWRRDLALAVHDRDTVKAAVGATPIGASANPDALAKVVAEITRAGWVAGLDQAQRSLGVALTAEVTDWGAWSPGWEAAAAQVSATGLDEVLSTSTKTAQGITDTALERLSTTMQAGLTAGDSSDTIAAAMSDVISDPAKAAEIAVTEANRAMSAASIATYSANGVTQWDWLVSDPCLLCADQEAGNPHDVGDDTPPQHPMCRCALSPLGPSEDPFSD